MPLSFDHLSALVQRGETRTAASRAGLVVKEAKRRQPLGEEGQRLVCIGWQAGNVGFECLQGLTPRQLLKGSQEPQLKMARGFCPCAGGGVHSKTAHEAVNCL